METTQLANFAQHAVANGVLQASTSLTLLANEPPWQSTALPLRQGQSYSLLATGRISWSKRYPTLFGGPRFHLWARIYPGGRAVNLRSDEDSFVADVDGTLELGIYMGMWANEFGELGTPTCLYDDLEGHIDVVALCYAEPARDSLRKLKALNGAPAAIERALANVQSTIPLPEPWRYLQEAGHSNLYRFREDSEGQLIEANAVDDQGILRHAVNFPLNENTKIAWRWRVDQHPSLGPENRAITHDYISLATEFENGRDLTWIWSSTLAKGTHFHCPVKAWSERETHYVIRNDDDSLGVWYEETRNVFTDVSESMGTPPTRITAVWLIALSTFQHRAARASFREIHLLNGNQSLRVL